VNRAHGGGLFGIEAQALAGYRKPVRQSVRAGASLASSARPLPAQRLQGRVVKFQFGNLMAPDLP
jgi:hypothetical protein